MVNAKWLFLAKPRAPESATLRRSVGVGEKAMTRRLAKIIQFGAKRRHVHVRVLATGDLIRVLPPRRSPIDDEGPRAA
jgi:hypothetical protein